MKKQFKMTKIVTHEARIVRHKWEPVCNELIQFKIRLFCFCSHAHETRRFGVLTIPVVIWCVHNWTRSMNETILTNIRKPPAKAVEESGNFVLRNPATSNLVTVRGTHDLKYIYMFWNVSKAMKIWKSLMGIQEDEIMPQILELIRAQLPTFLCTRTGSCCNYGQCGEKPHHW